ncbi:MAG: DegV family protein [Anaerolineaceae bacterium]|nr:DegV family protein [Anaerolineaceae bacterium]
MNKIALVTDTDASLPDELVKQYGIHIVPINIHFSDEAFESGIDIDDDALFERIDREGKLPTTSAPSPKRFANAYQEAFDKGAESVLCFTVSSVISSTFNSAVTAREQFPDKDITVVDTLNLSMSQGFMVLEAAKAIEEGAAKEEVLSRAKDVGDRVFLFGALSTLKYLSMSGRVGKIAAGMAGLLDIKPVLTSVDGKLDMLEKVRTRKKAWARTIELAINELDGRTIDQISFFHVACRDELEEFKKEFLKQVPDVDNIIITCISPGLSVHSGSGLVGLSIVPGK